MTSLLWAVLASGLAASVPVAAVGDAALDYRVGVGDVLQVTLGGVEGTSQSCRVQTSGAARLPRVGDVLVLDVTQPYTLWAGLVGGVFLTVATHGTDHYLVQRLLVARSERDARIGLVLSGVIVFLQFAFFLLLGSVLWVYFGGRPFARGDEVLPTFVAGSLAGGWIGFILAAVVAAALSPSLNAMAATTVKDFYVPYVHPQADEAQQVRVGRACTAAWGLLQIGVALLARDITSALDRGLAALAYASGPTVGAFLLGVLVRRADARGTLLGMLTGLAVSLAAGPFLAPRLFGAPGLAWTWNVAVGAVITVAVGSLAGRRPAGAIFAP